MEIFIALWEKVKLRVNENENYEVIKELWIIKEKNMLL